MLCHASSLISNTVIVIMMQMKKKHQKASDETHLIKTTQEANTGDKTNP